MAKQHRTPEERARIIADISERTRTGEVTIADAAKAHGITKASYYAWRCQLGHKKTPGRDRPRRKVTEVNKRATTSAPEFTTDTLVRTLLLGAADALKTVANSRGKLTHQSFDEPHRILSVAESLLVGDTVADEALDVEVPELMAVNGAHTEALD